MWHWMNLPAIKVSGWLLKNGLLSILSRFPSPQAPLPLPPPPTKHPASPKHRTLEVGRIMTECESPVAYLDSPLILCFEYSYYSFFAYLKFKVAISPGGQGRKKI